MNIDDILGYLILGSLLFFSILELFRDYYARECWRKIQATIINSGETKTRSGKVYQPVFRYEVDGTPYESRLRVPTFSSKCCLHKSVTIYVKPSKPETIRFPTFHDSLVYVLVAFFSAVLLYVVITNPWG